MVLTKGTFRLHNRVYSIVSVHQITGACIDACTSDIFRLVFGQASGNGANLYALVALSRSCISRASLIATIEVQIVPNNASSFHGCDLTSYMLFFSFPDILYILDIGMPLC
jgi:hypothetical protein